MPDVSDLIREGNDLAAKKQFSEALERYRAAACWIPIMRRSISWRDAATSR